MFDSFIACAECIRSLEDIRSHSNVKNLRSLPRGWVFYEFHHELFDDPDFLEDRAWIRKTKQFPELKQKQISMREQERAFLAPWYAKKKKPGDADALMVSEICQYRVCSLTPMKWVEFAPPIGWGTAQAFTVSFRLRTPAGRAEAFSQLLAEWIAAASEDLSVHSTAQTEDSKFQLQAKCRQNTGHWIASLWVLFSDARPKTQVVKMSVALE